MEERNDTRTSTFNQNSQLVELSQQETHNSSQSCLLQARIASNLAKSQKIETENDTESSEDLDFEALSNFEDISPQDSTTSDSDETVISDFDELEGVSDGELAFSDQSQPSSPLLLLGSTKTTLRLSSITHDHENPHTSLDHEVAMDTTPMEPMDTSCEHKGNFDEVEGYCCSDEDNTMCSPMIVFQDRNAPRDPISSQTQFMCSQVSGDDSIAALPDLEREQHTPGIHEQAKKPKDECDTDHDSMSHLSDREWTELSFESPVFIQGGNGNNDQIYSTDCCNNITGTATQQCIPPTVANDESCEHENATDFQNNSAFDSLEHYEDTLSQDDTICIDALVTSASHNSTELSSATTCSYAMLARRNDLCEDDGAVVRGVAPERITNSPLTNDITDEDFCWEE